MMPLRPLLKNKLLLQKHYHINELSINDWPYWLFEENISIANELTDEEDKQRKSEEDKQKSTIPNFNPGNYMKDMGNMASKFK